MVMTTATDDTMPPFLSSLMGYRIPYKDVIVKTLWALHPSPSPLLFLL